MSSTMVVGTKDRLTGYFKMTCVFNPIMGDSEIFEDTWMDCGTKAAKRNKLLCARAFRQSPTIVSLGHPGGQSVLDSAKRYAHSGCGCIHNDAAQRPGCELHTQRWQADFTFVFHIRGPLMQWIPAAPDETTQRQVCLFSKSKTVLLHRKRLADSAACNIL